MNVSLTEEVKHNDASSTGFLHSATDGADRLHDVVLFDILCLKVNNNVERLFFTNKITFSY